MANKSAYEAYKRYKKDKKKNNLTWENLNRKNNKATQTRNQNAGKSAGSSAGSSSSGGRSPGKTYTQGTWGGAQKRINRSTQQRNQNAFQPMARHTYTNSSDPRSRTEAANHRNTTQAFNRGLRNHRDAGSTKSLVKNNFENNKIVSGRRFDSKNLAGSADGIGQRQYDLLNKHKENIKASVKDYAASKDLAYQATAKNYLNATGTQYKGQEGELDESKTKRYKNIDWDAVKAQQKEGDTFDTLRRDSRDVGKIDEQIEKDFQKIDEAHKVQENIKKEATNGFTKFLWDAESEGAKMLLDQATGLGNPTGTFAGMGSRAFGASYKQAKNAGATDREASLFALANSGKEIATEKMFGLGGKAMRGYGGGLGDDVVERGLSKLANRAANKMDNKVLKNLAYQGLNHSAPIITEALEEGVADIAEPAIANLLYANAVAERTGDESVKEHFSAKDMLYDMALGGFLGGLSGTSANVQGVSSGRRVKEIYGENGLKDLAEKVSTIDEDIDGGEQAKAISQMVREGKSVAYGQYNELYNAAQQQAQRTQQNIRSANIAARDEMQANGLSDPYQTVRNERGGVELQAKSKFVQSHVDANLKASEEAVNRVLEENKGEFDSRYQLDDQGRSQAATAIARVQSGNLLDQSDVDAIIRNPVTKTAYEQVTGDKLPETNKEARDHLIQQANTNKLKMARAERADVFDKVKGLATESEAYGAQTREVMHKVADSISDDMSMDQIQNVLKTADDIVSAARAGVDLSSLEDLKNPIYDAMDPELRSELHEAAVRDNGTQALLEGEVVKQGEAIAKAVNRAQRAGKKPVGIVRNELSPGREADLTQSKRRLADAIARAFGINIVVTDKEALLRPENEHLNEEEKARLKSGELDPNGFYDKEGNIVWLIDSSMPLEFVLSHESFHHIRRLAPVEFKKMKDLFVSHSLAKDKAGFEARIKAVKKTYEKENPNMTDDEAIEEIMGDQMYEIWKSENFWDKLEKEEPSLAQAIRNAIRDLLDKIRSILMNESNFRTADVEALYYHLGILSEMEDLAVTAYKKAIQNKAAVGRIETKEDTTFHISSTLKKDLKILFNSKPSNRNPNEVYVGTSSQFMTEVIGAEPYDVLMPKAKAYAAMATEEEAKKANRYDPDLNYHGLGVTGLIEALESSENPVMSFISKTDENGKKRDDCIVLVTDKKHNGNPVVVVQTVNVKGMKSHKKIDTNKVITVYDKNYVDGMIKDAIADDRVLSYDKRRIGATSSAIEIQFLDRKGRTYFENNIQKFWDNVNYKRNKRQIKTKTNDSGQTSMAEAFGKAQTAKSSKKQFSLSKPVERKGDLIAQHNLTDEDLQGALDLGGFPMPSIAVIKADMGHDMYGGISLLFHSDTIDPKKNRRNQVYGGDAYTPTFPGIEYRTDEEMAGRIRDLYYDLQDRLGYDAVKPLYNYANDLENQINRAGGEAELIRKAKDDPDLMRMFLKMNDRDVQDVVNETEESMSQDEIERHRHFIDALGEDVVSSVMPPDDVRGKDALDYRREWAKEHKDAAERAYRAFLEDSGFDADTIDLVIAEMKPGNYVTLIRGAANYLQNGPTTTRSEVDREATEKAVRDAARENGYDAWVDSLLKGIETGRGIRNNKEVFTASGRRRSWDALHDDVTLENVVKSMNAELAAGGNGLFGANPKGAAQKKYRSLDEVRADKDRLRMLPEEEYKRLGEEALEKFTNVCRSIAENNEDKFRSTFGAAMDVGEAVAETLNDTRTKAGIAKELRKWWTVSDQEMDDLMDAIDAIANLPTGYFEAKPQRAVGFDEVKAAVVPNTTSEDLKTALADRGVDVIEYDPEKEGDRAAKVNQAAEERRVKFKLNGGIYTDPKIKAFIEAKENADLNNTESARKRFENRLAFYSQYQDGIASRYNYFNNTIAIFEEIQNRPSGEPFQTHSSEYWIEDGYVIRGSDHWGLDISSCDWALKGLAGNIIYGDSDTLDEVWFEQMRYGKVSLADFVYKTHEMMIDDVEILTSFANSPAKGEKIIDGRIYRFEDDKWFDASKEKPTGKPLIISTSELNANLQDVHNMDPVGDVSYFKLNLDQPKSHQVKDVYDHMIKISEKVLSSEYVGDVELSRRGIASVLGHGSVEFKASIIEAVPYVIKHGKVVAVEIKAGRNQKVIKRVTLAAPVTYLGKGYKEIPPGTYFTAVTLERKERSPGVLSNKLRLIDALIIEKGVPNTAPTIIGGNSDEGHLSLNNILEHIASGVNIYEESNVKFRWSLNPTKLSKETNAEEEFREYVRNHPDYEKYRRIEDLEAEKNRIIEAAEGTDDEIGNARLDEIEQELEALGRYDSDYEARGQDLVNRLSEQFRAESESWEAQPPIEDTIASEDEAADYIEDHAEEFPDSVPLGDLKAMEGHRRKQMTIAELQEEVQRQKDERKLTHGKILNKKSVKGEFNELVRTLLSGGYASTRTNNDAVNGLVANASTVYRAMKEDYWDAVCDVAYETARELVETMVIRDDAFFEGTRDLREDLRLTRIVVPESVRSDIPDYNDFRKAHMGKLKLVSEGGAQIDVLYEELCEQYPELFDDSVTNPTDQLLQIAEVRDRMKPYDEMLTSEEAEDLTKQIATDIIDITYENGESKLTWADKKKQQYDDRLKAMNVRHQEALRAVRKTERQKADQRVKEEREKAQRRLEGEKIASGIEKEQIKKKHKEKEQKRRDRAARKKAWNKLKEDYNWLVERILNPTETKPMPEALRKPLAEILCTIDLQTERSKELQEKTGTIAQRTLKMTELRATLADFAKQDASFDAIHDEEIEQLMKEFDERTYGMSIDQLSNEDISIVADILRAIRREVANMNRSFKLSKDMSEMGEQVIWEATEHMSKHPLKRDGGLMRDLLGDGMTTPRDFFENLGPGMFEAFMNLRNGDNIHMDHMKEAREFFTGVFQKYWNKKKPGSKMEAWRDPKKNKKREPFKLASGETIELTPAQVMSLYCAAKRDQAVGHILGCGIVPSDVTIKNNWNYLFGKKQKNMKTTRPVNLTHDDVLMIIDSLTDEQREVADKLQEYLVTTCAEWGNETSMAMYGYKKFVDENYFPIQSEAAFLDSNFEKKQRGGVAESIKNFGFTKGTVVDANNAIVIDDIFTVCAKHISDMSLYNAYAEAIADFTRLYNYRTVKETDAGLRADSVKSAIAEAYGKNKDVYITNFMADVQNQNRTRKDPITGIADFLLANYKKAAIGANLRVAAQQPTAIVRALNEISPKYFLKMDHTPWMARKRDERAFAEMVKWCPVARRKSWGFSQTDLARPMEEIIMNKQWSRIDMVTMEVYGALDNYTWTKIWKAVKAETKDKHPNVEYESEEFFKICAERATEVFDKTQVVDSVFHRSDVMRSKNQIAKVATAFMAEPTRTYNMLKSDIVKANELWHEGDKAGAVKRLNRTLTVFTANALACALAQTMIDALRGKGGDDDDDDDNKYLKLLLQNWGGNMNPLGLIPILKDIPSYANGYGSKNMAWDGLSSVTKDCMNIYKWLSGQETKKSPYELIFKLAEDQSYVTGVPLKNFLRDAKALMDMMSINPFAATIGGEEDTGSGSEPNVIQQWLSDHTGFGDGSGSKDSGGSGSGGGSPESSGSDAEADKKSAVITNRSEIDYGIYERSGKSSGWNRLIRKVSGGKFGETEGEYYARKEKENHEKRVKDLKALGDPDKIYDKATKNYTKLVAAGDIGTIHEMRQTLKEAGGDVEKFDKNLESKIKSQIRKDIGGGEDELYNMWKMKNVLMEDYGWTEEQISNEIIRKSDLAKEYKAAAREEDREKAQKIADQLGQAGLTQADLDDLYVNRWRGVKAQTTGQFQWPVSGRVSSHYGRRWGKLHAGMDIAVPVGTPVSVADGGTVIHTGKNGAMGIYVDVRHDNGYITRYQHLSSYGVQQGQKVTKGQEIAKSGNTGYSTGPHLHFAVYRGGTSHANSIDPEKFLRAN